jgi:1A family penicillin-binding protein
VGGKKHTRKLTAQKLLASIGKVFIFIGKPFFFILFIFLTIFFQILSIPALIIKTVTKILLLLRPRRTKGTIFSGNALKIKIGIKSFQKKVTNIYKWYENFLWNTHVFILAVGKLIPKIAPKPRRAPLVRILGFTLILIFFISFIGGLLFWQFILKDLPSPSDLTKRKLQVSTKIYDRNHVLLYTIFKDEKRTPVTLDEIPIQVRLATIAAEDKDFYTHPGVSLRGIARAIYLDMKEGRITGGSTITQQLVKNALLTPERTIVRKLKEIVLAIEVERTYSKDKILEMYLNEVPYGGTAYGIEEAANTFFDKDVSKLTLGEAALLAGLPQSPTKYSPFGPNPEDAFVRQKEILERMYEKGFITKEQEKEAENEKITFAQSKVSIKAPHFVFYVRDLLEEKYGKEVVQQGGLEVTTTLNYQIQRLAEEIVRQEVDKLKDLNVTNAAVIVLDPKTGEVLAMVGSKDYYDTAHGGNVNVTIRPRQPGSSIKVVNYAYALSNGLTPATIIPDTPVTFEVKGQPPYTPKNYEGEFKGNLTLRSALAQSRNIPAVKVLASYGVDKMVEMGTKMGITTWVNPNNYGLSLTLGGGDVKLIDLARVYATIADYGKRPDITSVLKVTNYQGKTLEEFKCTDTIVPEIVKETLASGSALLNPEEATSNCGGEEVLDPRVAFILTDILKDNNARAPEFGTNSLLVIKNHPEVAVKTGTSNSLRDNLTVGYTKDYLVAVWIGNNDNSPMSRVASGITGATPIFNRIMSALLLGKASYEWPVPNNLVQLPICPLTGTLACEGCPVKNEWFLNDNELDKACDSSTFQKPQNANPQSVTPTPSNPHYFEDLIKEKLKKDNN